MWPTSLRSASAGSSASPSDRLITGRMSASRPWRARAEEVDIGIARQRRDDGAVAAGKLADVEHGAAPRLLAERRVELVDRVAADALGREIVADDGVGGARIDVVGAEQEEAAAAELQEMVDRRQRLLRRRRAGVDDVRRLLLALVLTRVEQQAVVFRQHRQHALARGRR